MTDNLDPMQLDPIPTSLPADTEYLGSKMDQLIAAVIDLEQATVRQETPAPGLFFANTNHNDFPQAVKTRITGVIISVSAATVVTIKVGSAAFIVFDFGAAGAEYFPLPTSIDGGKDVTVTNSTDKIVQVVFLGYAESDRPA